MHIARLVAGQPGADQVQAKLVLAEHHQVGQVVVAGREAVAVAPVDSLDHRQPGLEHAHVVAGLVRPDLLVNRPQLVLAVVARIAQPAVVLEVPLDARLRLGVDVRLHEVGHAGHHAPAGAEADVGLHHQALLVLHRQGHAHAVGLPLGDVQQPGVRLVHRGVVRDARVDDRVRHPAPRHFEVLAEVAGAAVGLVHLDAVALVNIDPAAPVPGLIVVRLREVELLEAQLLQAQDETFVEIGVGGGPPEVHLGPPPVAHRGRVRLEDDAVGERHAGPVHRHKDFARQLEPFAPLGLRVHFLLDARAADEHRLGIGLDERVEAEVGLRGRG